MAVPVWSYAVVVQSADGAFHAYAADVPEAIASGETPQAARDEMRGALVAAVRGRIRDGMDLPEPARGRDRIALPSGLAAKAAIYAAWKKSGLSKVALAARTGRSEGEVRRILDPDHRTKLDQLAEAAAAAALGLDLIVGTQVRQTAGVAE